MKQPFVVTSCIALSIAVGLAACGPLRRAEPVGTPAEGTAGGEQSAVPTIDLASVPNCQSPATEALGLGVTEFATEEEMRAALPVDMLFPDPATLPEEALFHKGYYNAGMQGEFKQSTMGLIYHIGDQSDGEKAISVLLWAQAVPLMTPREPHELAEVRGGKTAYAFEPPFREGLHSLQWQENCRVASIIADLPPEDIERIAEGLAPTDAPPQE